MKNGLMKRILLCVLAMVVLALVFTACELKDPVTEKQFFVRDDESNYYNKDHTTSEEAVDEFTSSITALRKYLDSASFIDSGYYMGVNFDFDVLDLQDNTVGNFSLRVNAYLYTFPYEDDAGNPLYYYYENGQYVEESKGNNPDGSKKLISGLEIHNEAIKKSDISIEWYNGATNEVLIGMYYDGLNSNADKPGNIMYLNVQGYKRSFLDFGDTVLYQQLIRLLVHLSVEGLLEAVGLQGDAGVGSINTTMAGVVGDSYKRVVNGDIISLLFYSVNLDGINKNVTSLLDRLLGVFRNKWDPMTYKFLGFRFSTVAQAVIDTITADMQAIIDWDKTRTSQVLKDAVFDFRGGLTSYETQYTYTAHISFDYGWVYPEELYLDTEYYKEFDYGNYQFDGLLYVPAWDAQFDAVIKTDMQEFDNSTNNVFIEFRDIANGELMIGIYYREERAWLDITGLSYMYGWIALEQLGFPKVYDEHIDLADVLFKFKRTINQTIVAIVDSILDPSDSDKKSDLLDYIIDKKTSFTEKDPKDIFTKNSETLRVDVFLIQKVLEETGNGTYSTRQIINVLDSLMPYTMDQIAIMLGIASAEVMLEKTYFTFTWDVDKQEFTVIMYTYVGLGDNDPHTVLWQLELTPTYFGEYVKITEVDFSLFLPLEEIYTYSGRLRGNFIFSSQETVDLSKLLSATIGESSGLNTPYTLANNAGLSFTLLYDQFVKDQYVDNRWKKAGRSAFHLTAYLTESETTVIIELMSDDVCFDNKVYTDLPARERELGYIWVNIECVTKNGTQVIPKMKIRENVFMASMSAYMHNETSIQDDVTSFSDNDVNLSLTSIITALCKDAYVIPASKQLEITSSNETLQSLFRVKGLIGNIKVDAEFRYKVDGLDAMRKQYYMYEVGFFDDITGNSPYDTALHDTLPTFFYEDYMDDYHPLDYDFLVYADNEIKDDGSIITAGTMFLFEKGGKKTVQRQPIYNSAGSFFDSEGEENQDLSKVKFALDDLIMDPETYTLTETGERVYDAENRLVYEIDRQYYYRTYYGKQRQLGKDDWEKSEDGTIYIYWTGIREILFYQGGTTYYYFDRNMALTAADGRRVYLEPAVIDKKIIKFNAADFVIDRDKYTVDNDGNKIFSADNMVVFEKNGEMYYRTEDGVEHLIDREYWERSSDGTILVNWKGIKEIVYYYEGTTYFFNNRYLKLTVKGDSQIYVPVATSRNLLFEYDEASVEITEACKTQYSPRTNGSFMGEVRRYYVLFETQKAAERGKVEGLYYDSSSEYKRYYSDADRDNVVSIYDDDGVWLRDEKRPITLYVMEPCEPLAEETTVEINTGSAALEPLVLHARFLIDWDVAASDMRGYMQVTEVVIAPGMMGECSFDVRIIVVNREISALEYVSVYETEDDVATAHVPVVDEVDLDPYDYILAKYEYLSDSDNFNVGNQFDVTSMMAKYNEAADRFRIEYFSQQKFAFHIDFNWQQSYIFTKDVGTEYLQVDYDNYSNGVLTRYAWYFDACEKGNNRENAINPSGGTIYLHAYYKGQLIALKCNVGKREFSHVRFYEPDSEESDFDPVAYNANNLEGDPYVTGIYRGNYYDRSTYAIGQTPTFVFTDGVRSYTYTFNISYVAGLLFSGNNYNPVTVNEYLVNWGNDVITNVTASGSNYPEYEYAYVYSEETVDYDEYYESLPEGLQNLQVYVLKKVAGDKYVLDRAYLFERSGRMTRTRTRMTYADLAAIVTAGDFQSSGEDMNAYVIEYGDGSAEKFESDREGYAKVRIADTEGEYVSVNRPFYYYTLAGTDEIRYLTESEYEAYFYEGTDATKLAEKDAVRARYDFHSGNTNQITTAGLDLYYVMRLFFAVSEGNEMRTYGISVIDNRCLTPDDLKEQRISTTGYPVVELRIRVECPELDLDVVTDRSGNPVSLYDDVRENYFGIHKVNAGDASALGYYKVDPLDAATLYLPSSLDIYFKYEDFVSHNKFANLVWALDFENDGTPIFTYHGDPVIEKVTINGQERYKIALNVEDITGELTFRAAVRIGNEVSGYRTVSVAILIQDKEPTDITFYVTKGNATEKLEAPKISAEVISGTTGVRTTNKVTYYTYFANTFANFSLPDRLDATFGTGDNKRTTSYRTSWRAARLDQAGQYVFTPNTVVTLVTTIGTTEGVTIDVYLVVVVENYELSQRDELNPDRSGIVLTGDYAEYYVTIFNTLGESYAERGTNGELTAQKVRVKDLFVFDETTMSLRMQASYEYYVRISTGSADDGGVPTSMIGLYTRNSAGRYELAETVSLYEFLTGVYSKATLNLKKSEVEIANQRVINDAFSIYRHKLRMTGNQAFPISDVATLSYEDGRFTLVLEYRDGAMTYLPAVNTDGTLTIMLEEENYVHAERKITYAELTSYIIGESLASSYGEWKLVSVDGGPDYPYGTGAGAIFSNFFSFNNVTKKIEYSYELELDEDSVVRLTDGSSTISLTYEELTFRLTYYYTYIRVPAGTTSRIIGKNIGIGDLERIMNVNDMLVGVPTNADPDKYAVALGTGAGAYDMIVNLQFTGGYYLSADYTQSQTVTINVYTADGNATYADGFVMMNAVTASVEAIRNDGSGQTVTVHYNRSQNDDKLRKWYVTDEENNPLNISGINAGDAIEVIPASAIYATGKDRQITMSTLTKEGFRITRTIRFENLPQTMTSSYNGGNASIPFAATQKFAIVDGLISIENVYDYVTVKDGVASAREYLGSTKYLPTTLVVQINGRSVTVTDVEWTITPSWQTYLSTMTYTGTRGASYVMASAQILGSPESSSSQVTRRFGTTTVYANIVIHSAEIRLLPWDSSEGNGLATETLYRDALRTRKYYMAYVDAYNDADAVKSGIVKSDENGKRYVQLPTDLLVQYTSGKNFTFSDVSFYYTTKKVSKIYFDLNGIDVARMISSSGDLSGIQQRDLNERYLDLTVSLGLSQELSIRFYFHNKRAQTVDCVVYYDYAHDGEGHKVLYASLTDEAKASLVDGTTKPAYKEDAEGYAKIATLLYYYAEYVDGTGRKPQYIELSTEERNATIEGTDIPLFVQGAAGYARKASLVYNDVTAIIRLDDEDIRATINEEIYDDVYAYAGELLGDVNMIRVNYNVKSMLSAAQAIRSEIRPLIENCGAAQARNLTEVGERLLQWTTALAGYGTTEYPTRQAFTDAESYDFALAYIVEEGRRLASEDGGYAESIWDVIKETTGTLSANKTRAVNERLAAYYEDVVEEGFNAAIRGMIEREYERVLLAELSGMRSEEYNDAIYYKNMIEAGFDADKAVATTYKLRSLLKNNVDAEFAAQQLGIQDAINRGYGFSITYETYSDGTLLYADLSEAAKAETVSFGKIKVLRYGDRGDGVLTEAKRTFDYDRLAVAILVQALEEAYLYAESPATKTDENYWTIRDTVRDLFEKRLNLGARCAVADSYVVSNVRTYTVEGFRALSVGDDPNLSKKLLASYLVNLVREGMDFTAFETEDHAKWTTFRSIGEAVVRYSYNTIPNYATTVNSIRKSYSGADAVVKNLVYAGIKNYAETIYAEMKYVGTIRKVQELNGVVIDPSRFASGFTTEEFRALLEENLATYLVEPYYEYRKVPAKLTMYFESRYSIEGAVRTDVNEDVSGRPYAVTMEWEEDGVSSYVTYLGTKGTLSGAVVSPVTGETVNVHLVAVVRRKNVADNVITTAYLENGLALTADTGVTADGKFYMRRDAGSVRYYAFVSTYENASDYDDEPVRYILTYTVRMGVRTADTFSGYDEDATIVYEFVNHYDELGALDDQSLYVYNPFRFSSSADMPDEIKVDGELMQVKWNPIAVHPTGNITVNTDGSQQVVTGKIANENGQEVQMRVFVAQWTYAGMYRRSTTNVGGEVFTVNGTAMRFTYMNPLNFYFSAYMDYSPEDYYLVAFGVRILRDGSVKRVTFTQDGDVTVASLGDVEEGFIRKAFYPENSRLLEYGTDDDTMEEVNARIRYVLYWEELQKNRVIASQLSQQSGCLVYLGNDDVGTFSLDLLKATGDNTVSTKATYSCERMSLSETQFVDVDALTSGVGDETAAEIRALYNDIADALSAKNGQAPIVVSPDGYLPMTADVVLRENNVRYVPSELTVRLLWNNTFEREIRDLSAFVRYAYPEVDEASVRNYAKNIIMNWEKTSEAEKREIITFAMAYMRENNAQLGSAYTEAQCQRDAWDLLALNEKYNYAKESNRLRGGGNNNVTVTVLISVEGSDEVYAGTVTVKALFLDYSPFGYYELRDGVYINVGNSLTESAYLNAVRNGNPFYNDLFIEIRKNYWTENAVSAENLGEYNLVQPTENGKKIFRFYDADEDHYFFVEGTAIAAGTWQLPRTTGGATYRDELTLTATGAVIATKQYDAGENTWITVSTITCAYDAAANAFRKAIKGRDAQEKPTYDWTTLTTVQTVAYDNGNVILCTWQYNAERQIFLQSSSQPLAEAGLGDAVRITDGLTDKTLVAITGGGTTTYVLKTVSYDFDGDAWTVEYVEAYEVDGKNIPSPYDSIGDDMRKLLEAYALSNAVDVNGSARAQVTDDGYLVRVTNITWTYDATTHKLTSSSFMIGDVTYASNLIQLNLGE